jgi:hypothetical protein
MSDDDLNTQELCDRLNALTLTPEFDTFTLQQAIEAWWDGWQVLRPVSGETRTSYVLARDDVWVWMTVQCGSGMSARVVDWFSKDKHARAMLLFEAIRESFVSDYIGIHLAVQTWKQSPSQTNAMLQTMAQSGHRNAGYAGMLLTELDKHDPGVDRSMLTFMTALRAQPTGPIMPVAVPA